MSVDGEGVLGVGHKDWRVGWWEDCLKKTLEILWSCMFKHCTK